MGEDAESGKLSQDGPSSSGLMTPEGLGVGTASPGAALPMTLALTTVTQVAPYEALPVPAPLVPTLPPVADGQPALVKCGSCHQHNGSFKTQVSK
jgi:hypothetical protein